jgi:hypothetical protein
MNERSVTGTILFEVALLTVIVLLVDERMIRGALAFIPALLLAQRAIGATASAEVADWNPAKDRRMDEHVRRHITKLLDHFRDFYAMCHLVGSGGINSDEALMRANHLEKELNRLLDEVTSGAREEAGIAPVEVGIARAEVAVP